MSLGRDIAIYMWGSEIESQILYLSILRGNSNHLATLQKKLKWEGRKNVLQLMHLRENISADSEIFLNLCFKMYLYIVTHHTLFKIY
jgi:hypothetical protein